MIIVAVPLTATLLRGPRGWLHVVTFAAATLLAFGADAADPATGGTVAADITAEPAYRVVINAPPAIQRPASRQRARPGDTIAYGLERRWSPAQ